MNSTAQTPSLKRRLSFSLLMLYGLGTILGAGIYVLIGKVAGVAGMYAPIAFLVAGVLAGLSSYSFAKLSQRYPRASGEAFYVRQAFSLSWLAPLVGWMVVATGVISSATIARGFTGYLSVYVDWPEIFVMTVLLSALVLLACWGVAESVSVAALITIIELLGLVFVIWMARSYLSDLPMRLPELLPPFEAAIWLSIMLGGFLAFYAFMGFEDMVNMAEEVKEPEKTMPKAIFTALAIASVLYMAVAVVAVLALPAAQLAESKAPLVDLLNQQNAQAGHIIALISLVAVVNGALVQLIMGARVIYGMARQGMAAKQLGHIWPKTHTPLRATLLVGLLIWLFAVFFPLVVLAKFTSTIVVMVFTLVNFAQLRLHLREHGASRRPQGWLIPLVAAMMCLLFLAIQCWTWVSGL